MFDPQNRFQGAPPPFRPPAHEASRLVEVPPAPPRGEVPAPPPDAVLTVRPRAGRPGTDLVTLAKPLLVAVPRLRGYSPVDLVPPMRRGGMWHLDTRPTAPRRLPAPGKPARFAIPSISREHYLATAVASQPGQFGGLKGTAGFRPALTFALGPEVMEEVCIRDDHGKLVCMERGTGYYQLLPVR